MAVLISSLSLLHLWQPQTRAATNLPTPAGAWLGLKTCTTRIWVRFEPSTAGSSCKTKCWTHSAMAMTITKLVHCVYINFTNERFFIFELNFSASCPSMVAIHIQTEEVVVWVAFVFESQSAVADVIQVLEPFEIRHGDATSIDEQILR